MASRPSDIIVVGAGIIGCAIACELARRGASVALLDERHTGMGATQASAGVLAPYIEAEAGSPLLTLGVRSLDLFDGFITRISSDSGVAVPYRRTGTLDLALQDAGMRKLRSTAAFLTSRGVDAEIVDGPAALMEEPHLTADVVGGLLIPAHGFVAAGELTRALVAAARRHGAQVTEGTRVRRIVGADRGLLVETSRGTIVGNSVVLAAGSWSGQIDNPGVLARLPVRPVRGQLLHLAWDGPSLRRVTWSEHCYLVPWDDGTVLVGATVEEAGFDERTTVAGVRDLLEGACELLPRVRTAGFLGARVGLRPATPDALPIIGASVWLPNLFYATGHYRNGVLLAPLTAQLVADALIDNHLDPALTVLAPQRFGDL